MANTFKNSVARNVGTSEVTLYTVPSATTSAIIGLSVANTTNGQITISVSITDTSAATTVYLVRNVSIPAGSTLTVIGSEQKVILETTDVIKISSNLASSCDVFMSRMDIT